MKVFHNLVIIKFLYAIMLWSNMYMCVAISSVSKIWLKNIKKKRTADFFVGLGHAVPEAGAAFLLPAVKAALILTHSNWLGSSGSPPDAKKTEGIPFDDEGLFSNKMNKNIWPWSDFLKWYLKR